MTFQYKVIDYAGEDVNHYGLELARLADLPQDVLNEGRRIAGKLVALHMRRQEESESEKICKRRKLLLRVRTQLNQVLDHSALPEQELADYVSQIQENTTNLLLENT